MEVEVEKIENVAQNRFKYKAAASTIQHDTCQGRARSLGISASKERGPKTLSEPMIMEKDCFL
jgi:hypothetical protein